MSRQVARSLARQVRFRAQECCEYCRLPQRFQEAAFHIDHIQPRSQGGPTHLANLALACVTCSLRKGARIQARDPRTARLVTLFHPRRQRWVDHFAWTAAWRVRGRTPQGRATVRALGMNRPELVKLRQALASQGWWP